MILRPVTPLSLLAHAIQTAYHLLLLLHTLLVRHLLRQTFHPLFLHRLMKKVIFRILLMETCLPRP